ncbi:hypothetical protein [Burkholderia glumae]|uniref:hypothetical protein n=1 Tax=Burkholderia TaxID=32008 RepID=UPI00214F7907|nr:hypothetical protein [Burkholderia glumae]UVS89757.1 hypothetical protein EFP17_08100 [Burkholderia glumae]
MLPRNVADLVVQLRDRTERGEFTWHYDDNNAVVSLETQPFGISVEYDFNTIEEVGEFKIIYRDNQENKIYHFSTDQRYNDFEVARRLFDSAQASGLKFKF